MATPDISQQIRKNFSGKREKKGHDKKNSVPVSAFGGEGKCVFFLRILTAVPYPYL